MCMSSVSSTVGGGSVMAVAQAPPEFPRTVRLIGTSGQRLLKVTYRGEEDRGFTARRAYTRVEGKTVSGFVFRNLLGRHDYAFDPRGVNAGLLFRR